MEKLGSKLMVLSLARHSFNTENKPVSYEPYVREMNLWCELYDQVDIYTIIHPFNKEQKHKFSEFKYDNVNLINLWTFDASKSFLLMLSKPSSNKLSSAFVFLVDSFDSNMLLRLAK